MTQHPIFRDGLPGKAELIRWAIKGGYSEAETSPFADKYRSKVLDRLAGEQVDQDFAALDYSQEEQTAWSEATDLNPADRETTRPVFLPVAGGAPLIVPGSVVLIFGHRNHGKTWLAALAAADFLSRTGAGDAPSVTWIDYENQKADNTEKLNTVTGGALFYTDDRGDQYTQVNYVEAPQGMPTREDLEMTYTPLVVIDAFRSFEHAVTGSSGDTSGRGVEQCYSGILRPLAQARKPSDQDDGGAVIIIDHRQKSGENALGSERKESMADLVLRVENVRPFSREKAGYSRVICVRDRKGHYAEGDTVGYINVDSNGVRLEYDPLVSSEPVAGMRPGTLTQDQRFAEIIREAAARPRFYSPSAMAAHLSAAFGMNEKTWRRDIASAIEEGKVDTDHDRKLCPAATHGEEVQ